MVAGLFALGTLAGCEDRSARQPASAAAQEAAGDPWLAEISAAAGIRFVQDPGPSGSYFMPQSMGTGAALLDFDDDGDLDVYLLQNAGPESDSPNQLYEQTAAGAFRDVSRGSGLDLTGFFTGAAAGDVDNDGRVDLLLTEYGGLRLMRNTGEGRFEDVSREAGLQSLEWGMSAAMFDYDRDGWLDLFICNYVRYDPARLCFDPSGRRDFCPPGSFDFVPSTLYHNRGRDADGNVRFEDVTAQAGVDKPGPALGVVCLDFNGDRWPDIFVANDTEPNRLWINQGDGRFRDEAVTRGVAITAMGFAAADMGIAVGDIDGNGMFDLFVTHLGEETHTLWKQDSLGLFYDATAEANLAAIRSTGFGTAFSDLDHDGDLDLAFVNGRISIGPGDDADHLGFWKPYAERDLLLENDGRGRFTPLAASNPDFCGRPTIGRGLCCGELTGDGAVDLLLTPTAQDASLLANVAPDRGHWLLVRAVDPKRKRDAYGAIVTVHAGQQSWTRWLHPHRGYLTSVDPRAHFGLGPHGQTTEIEVLWPDGIRETFPGVESDQVLVLEKGSGRGP